jgi:hypothetical protein
MVQFLKAHNIPRRGLHKEWDEFIRLDGLFV